MKVIFTIVFCLTSAVLSAQSFVLSQGEYMDTTRVFHSECAPPYAIYYYQVKAKYPVSSSTLLTEARSFMAKKGSSVEGSGYVTFRFFINCKGTMSRVQVLQTDENYNTTHFPKEYVNGLYSYLQTLDKWPNQFEVQQLKNITYIAFISFKLKNGQIDNIIP
jgi:hypothetical protein